MEQRETKNRMGTMPVNQLMLSMGVPMVLSMMLQAVYNIVDSAFVSNMAENGEMALNALTLAFPVQMLMVAVGIGTGVGTNALLAKSIGQGNRKKASQVAGNAIFLAIIIFLVYFLFGLFGLPEFGVCGAAYATVIGQIASAVLGLIFHLKYDREIENGLRYLKPSLRVIGEIYSIGLPAIIAQALMSVMTYGLNIILVKISESAVTAYGLYYKIQQFILFAAFGLRDAITPIVSFNHGMRSKSRVQDGVRYGLGYTLIVMLVGLIALEVLAQPLSAIFGLSGETETMCVQAMRIVSLSFLFAGANIAFQGIFQALDAGLQSLVISVCRQILFVLPVARAFSLLARQSLEYMWLVWLTFLIAEGITALIGTGFMVQIHKKVIKTLA